MFYVVINHRFDDNGYAYGEPIGMANTGNAIRCEECNSFLTGLKWLPPFEIKISRKRLGDVIFGTFSHFIVSDKFKKLYGENGFTGIRSFKPVKIYHRGQVLNEKYYYPVITLSNVHIDLEKSGVVLDGEEQCSTCQKAGRIIKKMCGLNFSNEDVIKEDVFCTKMLPGDIVFSERFKQATSNLLNLSFTKAEEYNPSWVLE